MLNLTLSDMKTIYKISGLVFFLLFIYSCKKDNPPTVTTNNITGISYTVATSGGAVTDDGGAPVTSNGVCWNTSADPTISNSKTNDATGSGSFTSNLTQLTPDTKYYVRAYATNSAGTGYGSQVTFSTAAYPSIRLKSGTGLNYGAHIFFIALSKNVNYFDLSPDDLFAYRKADADWYVDGDVIPFTTEYKEFKLSTGDYYLLLSASGLVAVTTMTVVEGEQTILVSGSQFGGINFDFNQPKKSGDNGQIKPRYIEYRLPGQAETLIAK